VEGHHTRRGVRVLLVWSSSRHRPMFACPAGEAAMLLRAMAAGGQGLIECCSKQFGMLRVGPQSGTRGAGEVWTEPGGDVWWLTPCGCRLS